MNLTAEVSAGSLTVSGAANEVISYILDSSLFTMLEVMGGVMFLSSIILDPVVDPFMFVVDLAMPLILETVLETSFSTIANAITTATDSITTAGFTTCLNNILGNQFLAISTIALSIIASVFGGLLIAVRAMGEACAMTLATVRIGVDWRVL